MQWMQNDGFPEGAFKYDDGQYFSVDWTTTTILQSAIAKGPVKLGVAADQIEAAWNTTGGQTGWFGIGFQPDAGEDHCVSLCGYGPIAWLAQQLKVQVPPGVDGARPGYAMFTWNSIGILDVASMIAATPPGAARADSSVSVVARLPGHMDVFWVGPDGALASQWWDQVAGQGWGDHQPFPITPPGAAR